jgi:hypothetical protein
VILNVVTGNKKVHPGDGLYNGLLTTVSCLLFSVYCILLFPYFTCSIRFTSGNWISKERSIPARSVMRDMGQRVHEPSKRTSTMPSSVTRTNSTPPPSMARKMRKRSKLFSIFSGDTINDSSIITHTLNDSSLFRGGLRWGLIIFDLTLALSYEERVWFLQILILIRHQYLDLRHCR